MVDSNDRDKYVNDKDNWKALLSIANLLLFKCNYKNLSAEERMEEAKDLTSDTMMVLIEKSDDQLKTIKTNIKSFAYGILKIKALNLCKEGGKFDGDAIPEPDPEPYMDPASEVDIDKVRKYIYEKYPKEQDRKIFELHFIQGYKPREIEKLLKMENHTIRKIIFKIRGDLGDNWGDKFLK